MHWRKHGHRVKVLLNWNSATSRKWLWESSMFHFFLKTQLGLSPSRYFFNTFFHFSTLLYQTNGCFPNKIGWRKLKISKIYQMMNSHAYFPTGKMWLYIKAYFTIILSLPEKSIHMLSRMAFASGGALDKSLVRPYPLFNQEKNTRRK